jgi:hypothetical protein
MISPKRQSGIVLNAEEVIFVTYVIRTTGLGEIAVFVADQYTKD